MEIEQRMEEVLPLDVVVYEILGRLSDKDLFQYEMTSKRSMEICELIWKERCVLICNTIEEKDNPLDQIWTSRPYYYHLYVIQLRSYFISQISDKLTIFNSKENITDKKLALDQMYDYIFKNHASIFSMKGMKKIKKVVELKLREFINNQSLVEYQIGLKYYPLLFPEEYLEYLSTKYLYEDEEEKEDPDYV